MKKTNDLSPDARRLLDGMRNRGLEVIYRSIAGIASYWTSGAGEQDCTSELIELKKAGLVEIGRSDTAAGWFWFVPVNESETCTPR